MAAIDKTSSGRLFLTLFVEAEEGSHPLRVEGLQRGRAINLAQKLNSYHHRWAREQARPMLPLSAKARAPEAQNGMRNDGEWVLEVSFSPTNSEGGIVKPVDWLEAVHQRVKKELEARGTTPTSSAGDTVFEDNPL